MAPLEFHSLLASLLYQCLLLVLFCVNIFLCWKETPLHCSGSCELRQVRPYRGRAKSGFLGGQLGMLARRYSAVYDGAGKPIYLGHSGDYRGDRNKYTAEFKKEGVFFKERGGVHLSQGNAEVREQDRRK